MHICRGAWWSGRRGQAGAGPARTHHHTAKTTLRCGALPAPLTGSVAGRRPAATGARRPPGRTDHQALQLIKTQRLTAIPYRVSDHDTNAQAPYCAVFIHSTTRCLHDAPDTGTCTHGKPAPLQVAARPPARRRHPVPLPPLPPSLSRTYRRGSGEPGVCGQRHEADACVDHVRGGPARAQPPPDAEGVEPARHKDPVRALAGVGRGGDLGEERGGGGGRGKRVGEGAARAEARSLGLEGSWLGVEPCGLVLRGNGSNGGRYYKGQSWR